MSGNKWDDIDYQKVSSRANLIYTKAFMKHDSVRRTAFLDALKSGEAKINAGVLYPHDIIHKYYANNVEFQFNYFKRRYEYSVTKDFVLEELWKALPNVVDPNSKSIVVCDGSGSMTTTIGNTSISAREVAQSLAIYFSEKLSGDFKDKYITFSTKPKMVNLSKCTTVAHKLTTALEHDEVANTNIEAVFRLILDTAVNSNLKQDDIPNNIIIISDMEFDSCVEDAQINWNRRPLFDTLKMLYESVGYKLPRLVFWNVNSRSGVIPVKENDLGVALVSGFSVNITKMVMSGKTDPYECLLEILMSDRYSQIIL